MAEAGLWLAYLVFGVIITSPIWVPIAIIIMALI